MKYALLTSLLLISAKDACFASTAPQQTVTSSITRAAEATVKILLEQPDSIECWQHDRVYLVPGRIVVSRDGIYVCAPHSNVKIPSFAIDEEGVFILCTRQEAQDHYDQAWGAFRDAIGQSMGSNNPLDADIPVVGVYDADRNPGKEHPQVAATVEAKAPPAKPPEAKPPVVKPLEPKPADSKAQS